MNPGKRKWALGFHLAVILFVVKQGSAVAGFGLDVAVRNFKNHHSYFDSQDEKCAAEIRRYSIERQCSQSLVIPGSWHGDHGDDEYHRSGRLIGYNSWLTPAFRADFSALPIVRTRPHDFAVSLVRGEPVLVNSESAPGSCYFLQGTLSPQGEGESLCGYLRGGAFSLRRFD